MSTLPLTVFIGWDAKEPQAFSVLADSILRQTSTPVPIVPLVRSSLSRWYTRPRGPLESTDFSMTRFLVPFLSDYQGFSLFLDSDMLCQADVMDLLLYPLAEPDKSLFVCQHDYTPSSGTKFLGQTQTVYPRKNWSSLMLFRNDRCTALTPDYVNTATGLELHRFAWMPDEQIGALPLEWNWLVGDYPANPDAKILHYTLGAPCFDDYKDCDQAERWHAAYRQMTTAGGVHAGV